MPRQRIYPSAATRLSQSVAGNVPAWAAALADSAMAFVSASNSIADTGSTDPDIMLGWNGAAVEQTLGRLAMGANGGHGDYGGNEFLELLLRQNLPAFRRTRAPGVQDGAESTNGAGHHSDGGPLATHSYALQCCSPGRYWLPGLGAQSGDGLWTTSMFSYDMGQTSNGVYNRHGRIWTSTPGMSWLGGSCAYDPVDNAIWVLGQFGDDNRLTKIDVAAVLAAGNVEFPNQAAGLTRYALWLNPGYSYMAVAPDLRLLIIVSANDGVRYVNLNNPGAGFVTPTVTGTAITPYPGHAVYHQASRGLLGWNNTGATVRKLSIPDPITNTWVWSDITMGGTPWPNHPLPSTSNGVFSKFNILNDLGNGQSCLLYVRDVTEAGFYACKLPAGGV